MKTNCR